MSLCVSVCVRVCVCVCVVDMYVTERTRRAVPHYLPLSLTWQTAVS